MIWILATTTLFFLTTTSILVWFCKKQVSILNEASEFSVKMFVKLDALREHLEFVISLPRASKEPVIVSMIEHVTEAIRFLEKYKIYEYTEPNLETLLSIERKHYDENGREYQKEEKEQELL